MIVVNETFSYNPLQNVLFEDSKYNKKFPIFIFQ